MAGEGPAYNYTRDINLNMRDLLSTFIKTWKEGTGRSYEEGYRELEGQGWTPTLYKEILNIVDLYEEILAEHREAESQADAADGNVEQARSRQMEDRIEPHSEAQIHRPSFSKE